MQLQTQIFTALCLLGFATSVAILPPDEVESLRVIGKTLGKTDWNFNVDPCSGLSGWINPNATTDNLTSVICDCSFNNNTVCHVLRISLKSQNLSGTVPKELEGLPFLQEIDLSRNYLNGSIPREWGTTKLVNISLIGNRITGSIPKELANISTLANVTLEFNQLTGSIPPEFGNLSQLERLTLTSNNLSGEIPETLANLPKLWDFRISDNNFVGSIPSFIETWTSIRRLMLQASGLSGPIPSGIANLTKLTDLRISDLNGDSESTIPNLSGLKKLTRLVLRNCKITGQIPDFIGDMTQLKTLDLSFNKLMGPIPDNLVGLEVADYIYLTGNSLSGLLPTWIKEDGDVIDLSYNNLSPENSPPYCQPRTVNLFASSKGNTSGIIPCIRRTPCTRKYTSLNINCGGIADGEYEEDTYPGGASNVYYGNNDNINSSKWAFSSTGDFTDNDLSTDTYITHNTSAIMGANPQLYTSARLSPLSLTYYAYCLENGNYTVNLHFAEIIFTDDETYSSLGRRLFDVYIQGELVLKDFNIANEAGGVNRGTVKNFTVGVNDNSLDIRFYWAGKGTTGIPARGIYGPLVSAISVNPFV